MLVRTNYRTWIVNRWIKKFLFGHVKDSVNAIYTLLVALLAIMLAIPYLLCEGLVRLILILVKKYEVEK